jgi:hypothetical protein
MTPAYPPPTTTTLMFSVTVSPSFSGFGHRTPPAGPA